MRFTAIGLVGLLCIACLVVSVATAEKPDNPGRSSAERIVFTGDLEGDQIVEDCCPNAGPFPEYTMTFADDSGGLPDGTYDGQLFINNYGAGRDQEYIVQFWNDTVAIEIIGGVIDNDRKNKVTTVTFTDELCRCLDTKEPIAVVSFVLVRSPG